MCKEKISFMVILLILGIGLYGGFELDHYYLYPSSSNYCNTFNHNLDGTPTVQINNCPDYIDVTYDPQDTYVDFYIEIDENTTGEYRSGYIGVTLLYNAQSDADTWSIAQECYPATNSIQAQIDAAANGATITLSTNTTYTGPLTVSNKYLNIVGKNSIIEGSGHYPVLTFINSAGSTLSGITIKGGHYDTGGGVYCNSSDLEIEDCIFYNNKGIGYYSGGLLPDGTGGGLYTTGDSEIKLSNVLMYNNRANIEGWNVYRTYSGYTNTIEIDQCTMICNGSYNLFNAGTDYFQVSNSIIERPYLTDIIWTYCCAFNTQLGSFPGTGNFITEDPLFVDDTNRDYNLLWGSPCIDTGNPSITESDYSPLDVGCYPYTDRDIFCYATARHIWMCYPRLNISDGVNTGVEDVDCLTPHYIWENWWSTKPEGIIVYHENDDDEIIYGTLYAGTYNWVTGSGYDVYSWMGLKVGADNWQSVGGYLMDEGTQSLYTYEDLPDNEESWLGYYLEDSQTPAAAISSSVLDELLMIKTQSWSVNRNSTNDPWFIPASYKFNYADMVILVPETDITDFQWQGSQDGRSRTEPYIRPKAEHFEWEEEIDYLPIYVEFDPAEIPEEVAIYVNGICKGAQVVEDSLCQVCAYVLEEEPGIEIEFAFYDGERSSTKSDFVVLDNSTGLARGNKLYTGIKERFSQISFRKGDEFPASVRYNVYCSPNPFNPQTYICFELDEEAEVQLKIYNLKGQIVSILANELFRKGSYRLSWDGDTATGEQAGSGVYFYRLEIGSDVINGKMIMLK
ncbi:MAG: T9SS type A sorting domain-containing protein [Candidatus Cloacimonetes bacterium]|nr:T9SS type A sorting domain-containing protein [Candidatus Cloacimonadota bacterium]